jgi:integrase
MMVQRYFSQMAASRLSYESKDKIRDVLASVMGSAVRYGLLTQNPVENVKLPPDRRGSRRSKPYITPEQFDRLVAEIAEPYATMVYVAIYTGLRISELAALKWNDVGEDSITVDERYCRGAWLQPKSDSSNATIGVDTAVIERIHALKSLTISVRAGRAVRRYQAVKSATPDDLVFQSVPDGKPLRDNNILVRFSGPEARLRLRELAQPANI